MAERNGPQIAPSNHTVLNTGLKFVAFSIFGSAFLLLSARASDAKDLQSKEKWVACHKVESYGLFEQCEEVRIIKRAGSRVRAFSMPSKKLLNVKISQVFKIANASRMKELSKDSEVLIPAEFLWASSKQGYQTLCRVSSIENAEFVRLDCGNDDSRKVSLKALFTIQSSFDKPLEKPVVGTAAAHAEAKAQ